MKAIEVVGTKIDRTNERFDNLMSASRVADQVPGWAPVPRRKTTRRQLTR
ncbi:hypothetical protein [Metarhizobium album]|nr:hypothetical protein [Rhizobium album]